MKSRVLKKRISQLRKLVSGKSRYRPPMLPKHLWASIPSDVLAQLPEYRKAVAP